MPMKHEAHIQYIKNMTLRRDGTSPVEPWSTDEDGYHFSEDMTDKAIAWLPSPAAPFYKAMRIYDPEESVMNNEWTPPPLQRLD